MESIYTNEYRYGAQCIGASIARSRHVQECDSSFDRGVQYLSIRYTNRLETANLRAFSRYDCDSYDNALAETVNGLYKTEVIEYLKARLARFSGCTTCDNKLGRLVQ